MDKGRSRPASGPAGTRGTVVAIVRRRTVANREGIALAAPDAVDPGKGHERSWLVKTAAVGVNTQSVELAIEQPRTSGAVLATEEEKPDEVFEATILQLDGATLERLFRMAAE